MREREEARFVLKQVGCSVSSDRREEEQIGDENHEFPFGHVNFKESVDIYTEITGKGTFKSQVHRRDGGGTCN